MSKEKIKSDSISERVGEPGYSETFRPTPDPYSIGDAEGGKTSRGRQGDAEPDVEP